MKTKHYILIASALLGGASISIGSAKQSLHLENNLTSFLGEEDAKKFGKVRPDFRAMTERNLACPTFTKSYIRSSVPNLASATISKRLNLVGQDITSPMGRKFTITYLSITFSEDLITFMDNKNVDSIAPMSKSYMTTLLGMKHKFDSDKECGYDLNAGWGGGSAVLVIKRKE